MITINPGLGRLAQCKLCGNHRIFFFREIGPRLSPRRWIVTPLLSRWQNKYRAWHTQDLLAEVSPRVEHLPQWIGFGCARKHQGSKSILQVNFTLAWRRKLHGPDPRSGACDPCNSTRPADYKQKSLIMTLFGNHADRREALSLLTCAHKPPQPQYMVEQYHMILYSGFSLSACIKCATILSYLPHAILHVYHIG